MKQVVLFRQLSSAGFVCTNSFANSCCRGIPKVRYNQVPTAQVNSGSDLALNLGNIALISRTLAVPAINTTADPSKESVTPVARPVPLVGTANNYSTNSANVVIDMVA